GFGENPLHRRVGALACRPARAVGDRDEVRPQRREPLDRLPQRALHLVALRREELERDADPRLTDMPACALLTHLRTPIILQYRCLPRPRAAGRARATMKPRSFPPSRARAAARGAAPRPGRRPASTARRSRARSRG